MEIFISGIGRQATDRDLKTFLAPLLALESINTFNCHKFKGKGCAALTVADASKAQQFLARCAQNKGMPGYSLPGWSARFSISNRPTDKRLLDVLHKEEKDRLRSLEARKKRGTQSYSYNEDAPTGGNLRFKSLFCGRWEVRQSKLVFIPFFTCNSSGLVEADRRTLRLRLSGVPEVGADIEIVIDLVSLHTVAVRPTGGSLTVTITLALAPKIFEHLTASMALDDMTILLKRLEIASIAPKATKFRISTLCPSSPDITPSCLVYRFEVENGSDLVKYLRTKSMGAIPILQVESPTAVQASLGFLDQRAQLEREVEAYTFPYRLCFQIQALWSNTYLSPNEVRTLLPDISRLFQSSGEQITVEIIRRLFGQLQIAGPEIDAANVGPAKASALLQLNKKSLHAMDQLFQHNGNIENGLPIHKITVTPSGIYLYGPDQEGSNRVLRKYSSESDNFLRVSFLEEDGERMFFDRDSSNERIFRNRFKGVLRDGVRVGGKHFEFLGFSHSSLRSQTCWFMAPFFFAGEMLSSRKVVNGLGKFTHFRCPAKCAARIGQAFSDSHSAITIDSTCIQQISDIERGQYVFSDGVGTFSPEIWQLIRRQARKSPYKPPTVYQIRYAGAKGMISLDDRLSGQVLCLRKSMIKFEGSNSSDIEICGSGIRPLPMRLNRQLIKILEDLGVEDSTFEQLQEKAIRNLRSGTTSAANAISYLKENLIDGSTQMPWLLTYLRSLEIDATEDPFIRDVLGALIQIELRELKYRTRIFVDRAVTLYGVMDVTNLLKEGEIYCAYHDSAKKKVILQGRVAVTRSPALHPGDIQPATAIRVPEDSPLSRLHNCVVFSQQGPRDLPSMLSGGDLDGDLYNIIYDHDLIPKRYCSPADYSRAEPQDIGRHVTVNDMTDFFIDFMENDQLGRIASLHQIIADQEPTGTECEKCLTLAALHSTAVDFSKTGIPVNLDKIPKAPRYRPDFMAPSTSTKVEKGVKLSVANQEPDSTDPHGYRYYESTKILGKLYRAIDEEAFLEKLGDDTESIFSYESDESVLSQVWTYVYQEAETLDWREYLKDAREIKEVYECNVVDTMIQYSTHRAQHLTEKEVFIGTIMGRSGNASRRQREQSVIMKKRFDRDVKETIAWIRGNNEGAFERSIACLYLGKEVKKERRGNIELQLRSFGWVAAAVCMQEMDYYLSVDTGY